MGPLTVACCVPFYRSQEGKAPASTPPLWLLPNRCGLGRLRARIACREREMGVFALLRLGGVPSMFSPGLYVGLESVDLFDPPGVLVSRIVIVKEAVELVLQGGAFAKAP